jgi:hypothetical protein
MPGFRCDRCGLTISKVGDNYRFAGIRSLATTVDLRDQKVLKQIYDGTLPCPCAPPRLSLPRRGEGNLDS